MSVKDRLRHAWNAFINIDKRPVWEPVASYGSRPDRTRLTFGNERSIISSIYNRIALDVAELLVQHVRLDQDGRFKEVIDSGLNNCLNVEANLDQAASHFRRDIVLTLFDQGIIAIVPVDTTINPNVSGSFDIKTMRVGVITNWSPSRVKVKVYNEGTGLKEEIDLDKRVVAIVENPLYVVMNEPNSTLRRLIRKLNLLDAVDEQSSSGKLDIMIQLPYVIKSESKRQQAEQRRKDIELQLKGSQYGIAYIDGTEKVTQLNRPSENNLLKQVEFLTAMLYSQLGLTEAVMNGTAAPAEMLNYYARTIKPVITAIVEEMRRTFLTKTARSQGQSIMFFRDPFALLTMDQLAEFADKLTRNEVFSSNEIRIGVGYRPSQDPKADQLRNSNMPQSELGINPQPAPQPPAPPPEPPS